jgi:diguanylate cyclase (GGDEF)-like protein
MDRRCPGTALRAKLAAIGWTEGAALPAAVYRDLLTPLFTMRLPIVGFGLLYVFVSALILVLWPDPAVMIMTAAAIAVTGVRMVVLDRYHRAGGARQGADALAAWERRYTLWTFLFALLLAGLNVRVLMVHEPLMLIGTTSLVFTFGAGVVSRTSCRPRVCIGSLLIAVVPTALAMLWHATTADEQRLHAEFFALFAVLLLAVLAMSVDSVRHLHAASLEQLMTKHDLAKLARNDALTGLPNRLMLREAFHARLEAARTTGTHLAVHYLDLDGFKAINDGHGHPIGDRMLGEVANRLLATVRADDLAFRLGGDEFLLIQAGVNHRDEAELLARRVIKQLSEPYVFDGTEMRISVSVGIALAADFGPDLDDLVACADAALYRSKARGKAQLQFCEANDYTELGRSAA